MAGHVVMRPGPTARDGAVIEIHSELPRIFVSGEGDTQKAPEGGSFICESDFVGCGGRI